MAAPSFSTRIAVSVATETVFDTCLKIKHSRDSAVIVCGPGERVDGIFTERDVSKVVLAGLDPTTARIGDHMTISPVCVPKACDDLTAMRLMAQGRFRHLPVVDGGSLVGLHDSLCLGKALLHNGSKGMLLRAKNFVQSFFAAARKTGDEVSLATSLESLCAGDSSSLAADSSTTVFNALLRMAEHRSSALLVKVGDTICGIFTERDLVSRVVGNGKDARTVTLGEVMTRDPGCVDASASVEDALLKMTTNHYRHLPITSKLGVIIGLMDVAQLLQSVSGVRPTDPHGPSLPAPRHRAGSTSSESEAFAPSTPRAVHSTSATATPTPVTSVPGQKLVNMSPTLLTILKAVAARANQGKAHVNQMNFSGAINRFDFALSKLVDVITALNSNFEIEPSVVTAEALLTAQSFQIKILSQRADAYNFDGRLLEAISDAKSAVQAIKQHLLTIKLAQEKTGLQFEATAPAPAVEGTIPVCILGDAVSSQIHTQLSLLLIQSCDFAALRAVLAGLVCSNAEQTSNAKQLVLEALEAEVIHVIEAAEELASANEPLEAVRSYTIALDGIATMEAMGKVDWGMQSRVLIARAKLYRSNGNTPLAVEDLNRCQSECCSCLTPYTMLAEWSLADGDSIAALCHANQGLGAYLALGRPESQKEAAAQLRRLSSTAGIAIQADKENVVKVTPVKSKDSEPKDVMRELATLAMLMGK